MGGVSIESSHTWRSVGKVGVDNRSKRELRTEAGATAIHLQLGYGQAVGRGKREVRLEAEAPT